MSSELLEEFVEPPDKRILGLPRKLFHPERFLIVKILGRHGAVDFRELRLALGITDGNLASHLRALEQEGYIVVQKKFEGRRPRTSYELTESGRHAYNELLEALRAVLT